MTDDVALARDLVSLLPHLGRIFAKSARERGTVSVDRVKPLGMLAEAGPIRAGELADLCYLTPAAVTHAIDALVADGLVRREDDPVDRRAVLLHVTGKGRRELTRVHEAAAEAVARAVRDLEPSARSALREALPRLAAALARADRAAERV